MYNIECPYGTTCDNEKNLCIPPIISSCEKLETWGDVCPNDMVCKEWSSQKSFCRLIPCNSAENPLKDHVVLCIGSRECTTESIT